ncbi:Gfo/Idh/MocA family oxidoreductase [Paenibacillus polygoni]|uniref:Gfo/Idh/MocA family oxidoreductase n=1 Tax=Paenibacillus polygoni TaxID=3050112 RepID=A0ABY8WZF1_9BACL|nr:Gfo/Idh/MocA family oxidoreductase [Paenibacillus polygoni]WIV18093.1 Gfo/Idh/MocA family oxidoreductase [Paenibacillus polygoni]
MNASKRIKVAVIGLGDIARKVYLPILSVHRGVEIVGVLNRSYTKVEEVMHLYRIPRGTSSMKELLSWELDAVFIHSSTESHFEIVMACIEKGIAVYVDKPLSYHLKESIEMVAFAESANVLLAVGFNRRFAPLYRDARDWIAEKGSIENMSLSKHRSKLSTDSARITVYDDFIHMIDTLLWLSGEDIEWISHGLHMNSSGSLLQGYGHIRYGKNKEGFGTISTHRLAGTDLERVELHGYHRSIVVEQMETARRWEPSSGESIRTFGSWNSILDRRGFTFAVQHFLDHIGKEPEQCELHAAHVLASHELAEQILSKT